MEDEAVGTARLPLTIEISGEEYEEPSFWLIDGIRLKRLVDAGELPNFIVAD